MNLEKTYPVELFDAAVLSELMNSTTARRVLSESSNPTQGADQRRGLDPARLALRVSQRRASLGPELARAQRAAERHLRRSRALGFQGVVFGQDDYPDLLAQIIDPPPVLWVAGEEPVARMPGVAIVGSRAGSAYAREVAEMLASDLSDRGVAVVSGLARGVDAAAHRGALRAHGNTVGVLGCGLDVVYPPEHRDLIRQVRSRGALVSECAPGVPPRRVNFPRRNRIISGLSVAIVVVEATERSGSLITARCAADQGRDVLAVPGSVLVARNRGGHALIRDGAKLVEVADDILDEVGLGRPGSPAPGPGTDCPTEPVLQLMEAGETYDLDTLASVSGLNSRELSSTLVDLELRGLVVRSEMGRVRRLRR